MRVVTSCSHAAVHVFTHRRLMVVDPSARQQCAFAVQEPPRPRRSKKSRQRANRRARAAAAAASSSSSSSSSGEGGTFRALLDAELANLPVDSSLSTHAQTRVAGAKAKRAAVEHAEAAAEQARVAQLQAKRMRRRARRQLAASPSPPASSVSSASAAVDDDTPAVASTMSASGKQRPHASMAVTSECVAIAFVAVVVVRVAFFLCFALCTCMGAGVFPPCFSPAQLIVRVLSVSGFFFSQVFGRSQRHGLRQEPHTARRPEALHRTEHARQAAAAGGRQDRDQSGWAERGV